MARKESALGHIGLLFGVLAVLFMLGSINNSLNLDGTGWSAIYLPFIVWGVGIVFVVVEWIQAGRSPGR